MNYVIKIDHFSRSASCQSLGRYVFAAAVYGRGHRQRFCPLVWPVICSLQTEGIWCSTYRSEAERVTHTFGRWSLKTSSCSLCDVRKRCRAFYNDGWLAEDCFVSVNGMEFLSTMEDHGTLAMVNTWRRHFSCLERRWGSGDHGDRYPCRLQSPGYQSVKIRPCQVDGE